MKKEQARKIANLISNIARAEAAVWSAEGWGEAEKAVINKNISHTLQQQLADLIEELLTDK